MCLKLAHFALTNNCVECKEQNGFVYQQVVGTAIGTSESFSVVYAIIFIMIMMIWLETPGPIAMIIQQEGWLQSCIQLYMRFIDDLVIVCIGSVAKVC